MRGWYVAAWMLIGAGAAMAQPAAKGPERGTLVSAQAGDVACYLQIRDDEGRSQSWMADFTLCEGSGPRIGRRFALTWRRDSVQHPSCQGNPDCRRSQQVMLIVAMKPLPR